MSINLHFYHIFVNVEYRMGGVPLLCRYFMISLANYSYLVTYYKQTTTCAHLILNWEIKEMHYYIRYHVSYFQVYFKIAPNKNILKRKFTKNWNKPWSVHNYNTRYLHLAMYTIISHCQYLYCALFHVNTIVL